VEKRFNYGGQAVIDGVMMRGRRVVVTAVRRPGGGIALDTQSLPSILSSRARQVPLIRGILALIETMVLGIKSLVYSAEVSTEEEEEKLSGWAIGGMVAGSIAFAVGIFFIAPLFLTRILDTYIESSIVFHLVEGFIRMGIFLAYLKIMTVIPGLGKLFAYHGAEHKAVNAYEAGVPLELEAVRKYSTAHNRCGTSFLFVVLIIAIIVFSLIGRPSLGIMVLSRVVLVPVIAGIGYEIAQFGARHTGSRFIRACQGPGLWLQRLTTREPDDSQLEVGISALKRAVEVDHLGEEG